jgi:hypothetical protein
MVDVVTFLTILYVMVDDFCQSQPPKTKPGPQASPRARLSPWSSSLAGGALLASGTSTAYADAQLRDAFPTLPNRSQFNRLVRSNADLIESLALHLGRLF